MHTTHMCTCANEEVLIEYGTVSRCWKHLKASEMVQWVKMLAATPENVSLSGTHTMEGEN